MFNLSLDRVAIAAFRYSISRLLHGNVSAECVKGKFSKEKRQVNGS